MNGFDSHENMQAPSYTVFYRPDCPHSISFLELICLFQKEIPRDSITLREVNSAQVAQELINFGAKGVPAILHNQSLSIYEGDRAFEFIQKMKHDNELKKSKRGDSLYHVDTRMDAKFKSIKPPEGSYEEGFNPMTAPLSSDSQIDEDSTVSQEVINDIFESSINIER